MTDTTAKIREFKLSPERLAICRKAHHKHRKAHLEEIRAKQRAAKRPAVRIPEREKARQILRNAVAAGKVTKPQTCQHCRVVLPVAKIQAHHIDYLKPFDVLWLCSVCHGLQHRKEKI